MTAHFPTDLRVQFEARIRQALANDAHAARLDAMADLDPGHVCRVAFEISTLYPSAGIEATADALARILGVGWSITYRQWMFNHSWRAA